MKNTATSMIKLALCALAAAAWALPLQAGAAEPLRGWVFPFQITSREQAQALKSGAKIAIVCMTCKSVQLRDVDKKGTFLDWFTPNTKHVCPACGGHWEYVVYRKGERRGDWAHTCSKCGDKSMYCCSTQPGKKTKGM